MSAKKRVTLAVGVATVGVGAALLTTGGSAVAGHTNTLASADLNGRNEVRDPAKDNRISGDPDGKGEAYVFGIDGDPNTLCYVLEVSGIGELDQAPGGMPAPGRSAHIHEGQPGQNGPVVAVLAWPQDGQAADCLTDGEPGKFANGGTVQEILESPEDYYVNVHNTEYPGGAIRGQLSE